MELFIELNSTVHDFVWGPFMLALLLGTGIIAGVATAIAIG